MLARLVVEKGLASQEDVAACEQEQRRIAESGEYKPLAEILTERGVLDPDQAAQVSAEADYRAGRAEDEELATLAAEEGILPRDQLDECLEDQAQDFLITGKLIRLGDLLVKKGYATPQTSIRILEARERREKERAAQGEKPSRPSTAIIPADASQQVEAGAHDDALFSKLALQRNYVTRDQLQEVKSEQEIAKRYGQYVFIGDLLRDKGFLSKERYHALLKLEEVTQVLQQDMLFAKVGLQINKLTREDVDAALNEQREAVRDGQHPPPRLGELLFKRGVLSPEDSIKILETTEKVAQKLEKKKERWGGKKKKTAALDLGLGPDKRKDDRVLANLLYSKKILDRKQLLEAFKEQEVVERYGQAIPLEKILTGSKILSDAKMDKVLIYVRKGLIVCQADECDGAVERKTVPAGKSVTCPKCQLMLENDPAIQTAQPDAAPAQQATPEAAGAAPKKKKKKSPSDSGERKAQKSTGGAKAKSKAKAEPPLPTAADLEVDKTIDMPGPDFDDPTASDSGAVSVEDDSADYLGEYKIVKELGRGAMGVVYEAIQESLNRKVALKVLLDDFTLDQGSIDRFQREAESASKLHHENIVPIFDVGEIDDVNYYAMEFVEGRTLDELLTQEKIGTDRAVKICIQIARALEYAHGKGVIHRDIKPANIMVDPHDGVHLMDFGLAKQKGMNTITATDALLGTPMYMSPEQATQRGRITAAADIYALGVTLFEALTLETPFRGDNFAALVVQIRDAKPKRPSKVNPDIPQALDRIVLKALAKNPADRFASAGAMADDMERFLRNEKVEAKAPSSGPSWVVPAIVVVILAVVAGAAWALFAGDDAGTKDSGAGTEGPGDTDTPDKPDQPDKAALAARRKEANALLDQATRARLERPVDWDKVIPPLERAAELDEANVAVHRAAAKAYLKRSEPGDAKRALVHVVAALDFNPGDLKLLLLRGQAALAAENYEFARETADDILDRVAGESDGGSRRTRQSALVILGNALMAEKRYRKARDTFGVATDLGDSAEAFFGMAQAHIELEEYNEARRVLKQLEGILPDYPGSHYFLGRALQGLDELDGAIEAYAKELKLNADGAWSTDAAARRDAVKTALDSRDPYAQYTNDDPRNGLEFARRGMGFYQQGRRYLDQNQRSRATEALRKAAADFGKAFKKGGVSRGQWIGVRCAALGLLGDGKQLDRDFKRGMKDYGRHPRARVYFRDSYIAFLNKPERCDAVLSKMLEEERDRADYFLLRAEARLALGRWVAADSDLTAAVNLQPKLDGVPAMLGLVLFEKARKAPNAATRNKLLAEARDHLQEALERRHEYLIEEVQARLRDVKRELGG
ncbi:MAG: protein kinase domain-containing protein [Planctomycetota bacterium]|jgi:predicted Ser/Thr protein kinase